MYRPFKKPPHSSENRALGLFTFQCKTAIKISVPGIPFPEVELLSLSCAYDHWGISWRCVFQISRSAWGLRLCISDKLPGDAHWIVARSSWRYIFQLQLTSFEDFKAHKKMVSKRCLCYISSQSDEVIKLQRPQKCFKKITQRKKISYKSYRLSNGANSVKRRQELSEQSKHKTGLLGWPLRRKLMFQCFL